MDIVGRQKMAQIVDVTVPGLVRMEERGLPLVRKGRGGYVYDLKAVIAWLKEDQKRQLLSSTDGESVKELVARRAMAETRMAEIELAKLEGSLADVELLRRGLDGVMVNQRTILLSLPSQIGRDIDEPELMARTVAIVDRRVREALEALSRYDPILEPRDGASDDADPVEPAIDQAPSQADDQPVGGTVPISEPRRRRKRPVEKRRGPVPD